MLTKFSQLRCKEVICLSDGRRLGFISDARIDICTGSIVAIIVPGPCRVLGMLGRTGDYVIPWKAIKRIGPDIVLVDIGCDECLFPRGRLGLGL